MPRLVLFGIPTIPRLFKLRRTTYHKISLGPSLAQVFIQLFVSKLAIFTGLISNVAISFYVV